MLHTASVRLYAWSRVVMLLLCLPLAACGSSGPPSPASSPISTIPQALSCRIVSPITAPTMNTPGLQHLIALPSHPFASVATHDGHWLFVSLDSTSPASNGVAVLEREGSSAHLLHLILLPTQPAGLALTDDDHLLLVAIPTGVAFLTTSAAERGLPSAFLGTVIDGNRAATSEVILSRDERYAFATNELGGSMSVIDLQRIRANGVSAAALVGQIPLDVAPVGLAISPDNRSLYVTSELSQEAAARYGLGAVNHAAGTLTVINVSRAEHDPSHAIVARTWAGCSPVRVALSPAGDIAWVTARGSNALLAFNTARLLTDPAHALLSTTTVGPAPVGVLVIDQGAELLVANSNRFAQDQSPQTLLLLDAKRALASQPAQRSSILVGGFPRELNLAGNVVLLTNYNSETLSLIDLTKLASG